MLTLDFERVGGWRGKRVLDLGCGKGRHSFEAVQRGAHVTAVDLDPGSLRAVSDFAAVVRSASPRPGSLDCVRADAVALPFGASTFDVVVASEVLEHIGQDGLALEEVARVLRPGGTLALSVPRGWPERVCWFLSESYHATAGGHVRIYSPRELTAKLEGAGFRELHRHHAHALHSPYWWLKCALDRNGRTNGGRDPWPARAYHGVLVWDMMNPRSPLRPVEKALDPLLGKSLVVYARKQGTGT